MKGFELWMLWGLLIIGCVFVILYCKKYPEEIPGFLRQKSELFQRISTAIIVVFLIVVPLVMGGWAFNLLIIIIALEGIHEIIVIGKEQKKYLIRIIALMVFSFYIYNFYCLRQLCLGLNLLLFVVAIVSLADIFGWFIGKKCVFLPDKKILPQISPGKTWRGTIAGFLIPTLLSIPFSFNFQNGWLILLTFVLTIAGFLGDLLASYYKRQFAVKDFPQILPGHGGLLDRIDSQLMAITVLYWIIIILKIYFKP